jgi:hypothetical protein
VHCVLPLGSLPPSTPPPAIAFLEGATNMPSTSAHTPPHSSAAAYAPSLTLFGGMRHTCSAFKRSFHQSLLGVASIRRTHRSSLPYCNPHMRCASCIKKDASPSRCCSQHAQRTCETYHTSTEHSSNRPRALLATRSMRVMLSFREHQSAQSLCLRRPVSCVRIVS